MGQFEFMSETMRIRPWATTLFTGQRAYYFTCLKIKKKKEKKKKRSGAEVNCRLPTAIALPAGL
jgi:hypothetical protein